MTAGVRTSLAGVLLTVLFTALGYRAVGFGVQVGRLTGLDFSGDVLEFLFFIAVGGVLVAYVWLADGAVSRPLAFGPLRLDRIALVFLVATLAYQAVEIVIFLSGLVGDVSDLKPGVRVFRPLGAVNAVIMAPIVEEALFRGFLFTRIEKAAGSRWALMVSAVAFGAFHGENGLLYVFAMIPAGLFFGYARLKSGNIALSMAIHAWMNGSIGLLALLMYGWQ